MNKLTILSIIMFVTTTIYLPLVQGPRTYPIVTVFPTRTPTVTLTPTETPVPTVTPTPTDIRLATPVIP